MRHAASVLPLSIGVISSPLVALLVSSSGVAEGAASGELSAAGLAVSLSTVTAGAEREELLAVVPAAADEPEISCGIEHHGRELDDAIGTCD